MTNETVAQAWYRLLRTIGDPIDLCRPTVISHTQAFLQYAISSSNIVDPCQHACLQNLPNIFLKAIKGIAGQVDAFLGTDLDFSLIDLFIRNINKIMPVAQTLGNENFVHACTFSRGMVMVCTRMMTCFRDLPGILLGGVLRHERFFWRRRRYTQRQN